MRTTTITIIALVMIAVLGLWWFFSRESDIGTIRPLPFGTSATSSSEILPPNPTSNLTGPTLDIATNSGKMVSVANFIANGVTVADVVNPGFYVLAGKLAYCLADGTCLEGAPVKNFFIWYNVHSYFFYIILLEKPLGKARKDAEFFLEQELGVSPEELCNLNYTVGVPYYVDTVYVGRELGFSMCPGAVPLSDI